VASTEADQKTVMAISYRPASRLLMVIAILALSLLSAAPGAIAAQRRARHSAEQRTGAYMNSIRTNPRRLEKFLRQMPKGADLHNHLSGAVYAESYIKWAAGASSPRLCVDSQSLALAPETAANPCSDPARPAADKALTDSGFYNQLVDAWSMRDWRKSGETGHDHFFRAFSKFGAAIDGHFGDMLAEVASRAAGEHVSYLEIMLTPDNGVSASIGQNLKWDGNDLPAMRTALLEMGIDKAAQQARATLDQTEKSERQALGCDSAKPQAGCDVPVRFIFQVGRTNPPAVAFAQMVAAMETAGVDSRVVALNLVAPEDAAAALNNFPIQMRMLGYLHSVYPKVHITLHAGELAPALVGPEALRSHIRESVEQAHAERIGHGVDVLHEDDSAGLLKEMAARRILVEICLSSNDLILGVRGKDHPLNTYIEYGVPTALATDDEGVSRSNMTNEYVRAVDDQGLTYGQLKKMARASLEYSFASGSSLWDDPTTSMPVSDCAADLHRLSKGAHRSLSASCRSYLDANLKAELQWSLEEKFLQFEQSVVGRGNH